MNPTIISSPLSLILGLTLVTGPAADVVWAQTSAQASTGKRERKRIFWEKRRFRGMSTMAYRRLGRWRISSSRGSRSINTPGSSRRGHW
jgi:hypothetical protein